MVDVEAIADQWTSWKGNLAILPASCPSFVVGPGRKKAFTITGV
jgi:hypothetical protein